MKESKHRESLTDKSLTFSTVQAYPELADAKSGVYIIESLLIPPPL